MAGLASLVSAKGAKNHAADLAKEQRGNPTKEAGALCRALVHQDKKAEEASEKIRKKQRVAAAAIERAAKLEAEAASHSQKAAELQAASAEMQQAEDSRAAGVAARAGAATDALAARAPDVAAGVVRERERAAAAQRHKLQLRQQQEHQGKPLPQKRGPRGSHGGIAPSLSGRAVDEPGLPPPGQVFEAAMAGAPAAARRLTAKELSECEFQYCDSSDDELPRSNPGEYEGNVWQCERPTNLGGGGDYKDAVVSADANFVWCKNITRPRRPAQVVNVQEYFVCQKLAKEPELLGQIFNADGTLKVASEYTGPELSFENWRPFSSPSGATGSPEGGATAVGFSDPGDTTD